MTEHNIFQEIDADLERQKLEDLWKRYGSWVITLAILIVAGTGAYTSWHSWQSNKNQEASNGLMTAIQAAQADPAKEVDALEAFAQSSHGTTQATFAQLHAASAASSKGDTAKAVQIYDGVASDAQADPAFRQLADIMAVRAQLDTGNPADLDKRLQPLMAEGAPWRFTAMEYSGYLALRSGDKAKAKQIFTDLSQNAAVPQTMGARAADMLRLVSQ